MRRSKTLWVVAGSTAAALIAVVLLAIGLPHLLGTHSAESSPSPPSDVRSNAGAPRKPKHKTLSQATREECSELSDGQIAFEPDIPMKQGEAKVVTARLSRGIDPEITIDMPGAVTQRVKVSCMVSMDLISEEADSFTIAALSGDSKTLRYLGINEYEEWQWRVTPLRHGTLHLRLLVIPQIFVNKIGETPTQVRPISREITVTSDYVYEAKTVAAAHWAVISSLFGCLAALLPILAWGKAKLGERKARKKGAKSWESV